jgi:protein-tyrosine phosphatase
MMLPIPSHSWPGKLFVSSRPRGGDWLSDEAENWLRSGIQTVVSLLTQDEESELDIESEAEEVTKHGMKFISYPIPDRGIPGSSSAAFQMLDAVFDELQRGKSVLVHCRQGIGRSGLVAASLLVLDGEEPRAAIESVSKARGVRVPETADQEQWIYRDPSRVKGTTLNRCTRTQA